MARSTKQIKADISRIKLETKTVKQQMNIMAKQYEKIGYQIPKRIRENRATERDIQGYWNTINNVVNNRLSIEEAKEAKDILKILKELNQVQDKRKETVSKLLDGYGSNFVSEFSKGKTAILGYGVTFSISSTGKLDIDKIVKNAKRNNISPLEYINNEINSLKNDMQNMKKISRSERNYIANEIKELVEAQGFSLSKSNMNKIKTKLSSTDWLGAQKIYKTINSRIDKAFYEIYKKALEANNNTELLEVIFDDISKSSHTKMIMYSKIMGS